MRLSILIISFVCFLFSCEHQPLVNNGTTTPNNPSVPLTPTIPMETLQTCNKDTVYFQNDILPLITSNCATSGCHDITSHKSGITLTNYSNISARVTGGQPGNSSLYKIIIRTDNERMPPPPAPAFTTAQKALLYNWIMQGAKNNACNACDTTNFKYSTAIAPLITTNCIGCHSATAPSGNINLSSYTLVKALADNGKLYGSIAQLTGYSAMPKGYKLSDCQIKQVRKWIDAGSLNN